MPVTDDAGFDRLLDADTIAVVGCSTTPGKAAHDVPGYLQRQGYRVIPVNPFADEVLGEPAYDALGDVEEEIDLVVVFRPSADVSSIVDETLDREDVDTVWLQLGIRDGEAGERVTDSGRRFIQDKCLKVEHQRLCD